MRNLLAAELTDVHEYWGAARDRIPASASSDLASEPTDPLPGNLCLIRSGQVWEHCGETERALYFTDVEPNLTAGIDFLAEHPETGCISSRFLREQTIDGEDLESTSFVGWFRDLKSLGSGRRVWATGCARRALIGVSARGSPRPSGPSCRSCAARTPSCAWSVICSNERRPFE